jgi:hypothetical protein
MVLKCMLGYEKCIEGPRNVFKGLQMSGGASGNTEEAPNVLKTCPNSEYVWWSLKFQGEV